MVAVIVKWQGKLFELVIGKRKTIHTINLKLHMIALLCFMFTLFHSLGSGGLDNWFFHAEGRAQFVFSMMGDIAREFTVTLA